MKEGWRAAALAEKVPERLVRAGPGVVRRFLEHEAEGLRVDWNFSFRGRWLQVSAFGEDSEAFLNVLKERFGEAPVDLSRLERWDVVRGFVTGSGRVGFGVFVDIGLMEPVAGDGLFPLHRMRAQLSDGRPVSCRSILDENCLVDDFPVKVMVSELDGGKVGVELTDDSRELILSWRRFPFDRVVAVGVERGELEKAVNRVGLRFDVVRVESLGAFVHCLVCKIGTDSPGVVAKIGRVLRGVRLASYRSRVK